jgi:hypothetical protein
MSGILFAISNPSLYFFGKYPIYKKCQEFFLGLATPLSNFSYRSFLSFEFSYFVVRTIFHLYFIGFYFGFLVVSPLFVFTVLVAEKIAEKLEKKENFYFFFNNKIRKGLHG